MLDSFEQAEKIEDFKRRVVSIRERELATDDPELALALNDLGVQLRSQGQMDEAESLFQRALTIYESAGHPDSRLPLANLAWIHWGRGDFAGAIEFGERCLALVEHDFGPDHTLVATYLGFLGTFYRDAGQYERARQVLGRALVIQKVALHFSSNVQ